MIRQYRSAIHDTLEATPLEQAFFEVLGEDQFPQSPMDDILPEHDSLALDAPDLQDEADAQDDQSKEPESDPCDETAPQSPKPKPSKKTP